MEDDEESHHGDSTLNSHNSSFQAGGTTNRHQWHSSIVAEPTHGGHLLRIFIQISITAPGLLCLARPRPAEPPLCEDLRPDRVFFICSVFFLSCPDFIFFYLPGRAVLGPSLP